MQRAVRLLNHGLAERRGSSSFLMNMQHPRSHRKGRTGMRNPGLALRNPQHCFDSGFGYFKYIFIHNQLIVAVNDPPAVQLKQLVCKIHLMSVYEPKLQLHQDAAILFICSNVTRTFPTLVHVSVKVTTMHEGGGGGSAFWLSVKMTLVLSNGIKGWRLGRHSVLKADAQQTDIWKRPNFFQIHDELSGIRS